MSSHAEITAKFAKAYVAASKADKGQILHQFLFAHMVGRIDSVDADIAPTSTSRSRRVCPFSRGRRSWTPGSSSPTTWARRHPWCSRGWSATPQGAQPADTRRGGEVRQPTM